MDVSIHRVIESHVNDMDLELIVLEPTYLFKFNVLQ